MLDTLKTKSYDDNAVDAFPEAERKFDVIIGGNPTCNTDLHLKILAELLKHVDFENGAKIVWAVPAGWLQDSSSRFGSALRRFETDFNCTASCEMLDSKTSREVFSMKNIGLAIITK